MWAHLKLFEAGTLDRAYEYLGCHQDGRGFWFRVWAPNARAVQVLGSWNHWDPCAPEMKQVPGGIWERFCPEARPGDSYQYRIQGFDGSWVLKSDPYGTAMQSPSDGISLVRAASSYSWSDQDWMKAERDPLCQPVNVYEVHAGSWKQGPGNQLLSYEALADELIPYVAEMGYTHLELLPLAEHPYTPSWGYEITGFYAPTARFGSPEGLKYLVDRAHQAGIGVILDWVGAHFPKDAFSLAQFDGTCLYEASDALAREHPLWGTLAFDYEKPQVRSFLLSCALYWLREYHLDGLRVDAVSSMLYLDYCREPGQWRPGPDGDNRNHAAIAFLRQLTRTCFAWRQDLLMMAEESTTFPRVTGPNYDGGLGFNYKWNLGWMHDMLDYMSVPPAARSACHCKLTFAMTYAFSENFLLPLSHDEVVHGKRSLLERMPGSYDQKFANLRLLYAFMMAHPGKKLLFMGGEFGQFAEWDHDRPLDWFLLDYDRHRGLKRYVQALNRLYRARPALWQQDISWEGFRWIIPDDPGQSVAALERRGGEDRLLLVCNFSLREYRSYRIGVPESGHYETVLDSQEDRFGGTGQTTFPGITEPVPMHGYDQSLCLTLPPLTAVYFEHIREEEPAMPNGPEKQWVAMVLAGGQGSRLGGLTNLLAKPALSFGGRYRIIDFVLTNCAVSGVDTVGVLTQYQPLFLNEYVAAGQSWDLTRTYGGLQLLPPYISSYSQQWYRGTADAVYQNIPFLDRYSPRYVLILSADHIYTMDYSLLLRQHRRTGAVCTIAVREVPLQEARRMGIVQTDQSLRITDFQEKPAEPRSQLASMGIYLFDWPRLRLLLGKDAADPSSCHDFGRDIIPALLRSGSPVYACPFEGYWQDVGTPESLWQANMDLLERPSAWAWPIWSHSGELPPCLLLPGGRIRTSLAADGCRIAGRAEHSVLSTGCDIQQGAVVTDSVIMPGALVGAGARVSRAILGEGCQIGPGAQVGTSDPQGLLCIVGHRQRLPEGSRMIPQLREKGGQP